MQLLQIYLPQRLGKNKRGGNFLLGEGVLAVSFQ